MYFSPSVDTDVAARIAEVARGTVEFFSAAMPNARFCIEKVLSSLAEST
jgi:hypothetical protein